MRSMDFLALTSGRSRATEPGHAARLPEVNAAVKRARLGLPVGWHVERVNLFNPIFRATRSDADLATETGFHIVGQPGGRRPSRARRSADVKGPVT